MPPENSTVMKLLRKPNVPIVFVVYLHSFLSHFIEFNEQKRQAAQKCKQDMSTLSVPLSFGWIRDIFHSRHEHGSGSKRVAPNLCPLKSLQVLYSLLPQMGITHTSTGKAILSTCGALAHVNVLCLCLWPTPIWVIWTDESLLWWLLFVKGAAASDVNIWHISGGIWRDVLIHCCWVWGSTFICQYN